MGTFWDIVSAPFRLVEEFYYLVNRDQKARARGIPVAATVLSMRTERHTDTYGNVSYTHRVSYEITADTGRVVAEKNVGGLGGVKRGSKILAYFLPNTLHSTIEWEPMPLNPNPPKDTDGRREESGRGGEGATGEIAWVPFGVGRSADGLHRRTGAPMAVCGSCDARDGERIRSRELSRTGLARVCGDLRLSGGWVADGAVRPGVEWLAAGPRRG